MKITTYEQAREALLDMQSQCLGGSQWLAQVAEVMRQLYIENERLMDVFRLYQEVVRLQGEADEFSELAKAADFDNDPTGSSHVSERYNKVAKASEEFEKALQPIMSQEKGWT